MQRFVGIGGCTATEDEESLFATLQKWALHTDALPGGPAMEA